MSQNNYIFERSSSDMQTARSYVLHIICMIMLALVLSACGGGGGGGSDSVPQNNAGPVNPVDPLPPGVDPVDPGDPMPDPMDPNNPNTPPQANDQAIFAATLHPELRKAENLCIGCHDNPFFTTAIDFAVADAAASYAVITGQVLANLAKPKSITDLSKTAD